MIPPAGPGLTLGTVAAFTSSVTWAIGTSVYGRAALRNPIHAVNFTRALIALPLFVAFELATSGGFQGYGAITPETLSWVVVSVVASYAVGDAFFMLGTRDLGVPGALAIASCYPIWSALAGWILRGEAVSAVGIAGIALVLAGTLTVILTQARTQTPSRSPNVPWGVFCAVMTSFCWSLNTVASKFAGEGLSSPVSNTLRMGLALLLCPALGIPVSGDRRILVSWAEMRRVWPVFAFEAFGGALCFVYGLTHAPLAVAGALASLAPVISVPVAWALRTEPVSVPRALGVVMAVAGVWALLNS